MEDKDLELIQKLIDRDQELARLWHEHQELEARLEALGQRAYLAPEDEVEMKRLKKLKLAGRDRMETILVGYRQGTGE